MNLLSLTAGVINTVNPNKPLTVRLATDFTTNAAGLQVPVYETPTSFTGTLADGVLSVTAITGGSIALLQTISGAGLPAGLTIVQQLTGAKGQIGTYAVAGPTVEVDSPLSMTSDLILNGQIQPLSYKDLQQIEGLNLNGTRRTIYLYGVVDAIVRSMRKGGALIYGPGDNIWLVAMVTEQWFDALPSWCAVVATLQNERGS